MLKVESPSDYIVQLAPGIETSLVQTSKNKFGSDLVETRLVHTW